MKHVLLFSTLLVSTILTAEPAVYRYKLEGFPKENPNCHLAAMEAGKTFAAANPQVALTSAVCIAQNQDGYDFEIRYEAEERVKLVSTTEGVSPTLSSRARFKTREACEKQIPADRELFESTTGLTASFAFCYRDAFENRIPYGLRIDAYGDATLTPHVSDYPIFAVPESMTGEQYGNALASNLAKHGAQVYAIVSHSGLAMGSIAVHYYAEKRIYFYSDELTKVPLTAQCEAQVPEAVEALAQSANPPVLVYCARPGVTGLSELTVVFADRPTFRNNRSIEEFTTYEECESTRPELLSFYKETLHRPVLGGFCSRQESMEFRIQLFEEAVKE
ncbi:MAG: hypothetical protein KDD51_09510 [Bdellovibrionales bacterium]|nr:hypothetical protein [Bdellovibrionales bacterium]